MVYIHIPYCRTHCTYCAFYSELLPRGGGSDAFVRALCSEIAASAEQRLPEDDQAPHTLYIGGGTPSLLTVDQLRSIVEAVRGAGWSFDREFTLEVNPDDVVRGGLRYAEALREIGVSRISMGIQSFDDHVLHLMGRRHDAASACEAFSILRTAGFGNISIDIIFGFSPVLDIENLKLGLERLAAFNGNLPEHISCYQLSVEPGSGLEKMLDKKLWQMPSDEQCESQYNALCGLLGSLGYEHYEISNWARPGFRSCHNSAYWQHLPYVGFGPGAHSFHIDKGVYCRNWNEADLHAYMAYWTGETKSVDLASISSGEILSAEQVRLEKIMLGLRTAEGIDASLLQHPSDKLIPLPGGRLRIPENSWFVSDTIIAAED